MQLIDDYEKHELNEMLKHITTKYAEVLRKLAKYEKEEQREKLCSKGAVDEPPLQTKDRSE